MILLEGQQAAGRCKLVGHEQGSRNSELFLLDGREFVRVLQDIAKCGFLERLLQILVPVLSRTGATRGPLSATG